MSRQRSLILPGCSFHVFLMLMETITLLCKVFIAEARGLILTWFFLLKFWFCNGLRMSVILCHVTGATRALIYIINMEVFAGWNHKIKIKQAECLFPCSQKLWANPLKAGTSHSFLRINSSDDVSGFAQKWIWLYIWILKSSSGKSALKETGAELFTHF